MNNMRNLNQKQQFCSNIFLSILLMNTRSLRHPNIVGFFGIHVSSNGDYYIVTEYLSKGSLDNVIRNQKDDISLLDLLSM